MSRHNDFNAKPVESKPKYAQIADAMRDKILRGAIGKGKQIQNENALSAKFNVSRNTIRDAIAILISEGLLERQQGRGTFVSEAAAAKRQSIFFTIYKAKNPFSSAFINSVFTGVKEKIAERGKYVLEIKEVDPSKNDDDAAREIAALRPSGVVLLGKFEREFIARVGETAPLVLVGKKLENYNGLYAVPDNRAIVGAALEYLFSLGHRRIAYLPSFMHHLGYVEKLEAYKAIFAELSARHGSSEQPIFHVGDYVDAARAVMKASPTAVIASSDAGASAMVEIMKMGYNVPRDVSFMALDDLGVAERAVPSVTVYDVDNEAIGRAAIATLIGTIEKKIKKPVTEKVAGKLIVRDSTAALGGAR